ncbi:MAG: 3-dehydroquinate synthase [Actinomycetia bacterium]|nr:3-dehydroquinate synthase [Actinomycetes bacterium]
MSTVPVRTQHPYLVHVERGARHRLPDLVEGRRVALIHPAAMRNPALELAARLPEVVQVEVPDGEAAKTAQVLAECWEQLAAAQLTRDDIVVGFGGGSTTDLAGFVAATLLRGVAYLSLPTTLLAMVDAAVGGKTGINLAAGKNLAGAFYEPEQVLCDLDLLRGLPAAEVASGMAEVVKAGLVADPEITRLVGQDPAQALDVGSDLLVELVRRAVCTKAAIVAADLRERTGAGRDVGREALNYGHTLGHAIEKVEGFRLRHGEAVSIGMVFAAELAQGLGLLDAAVVTQHRDLLRGVGLPTGYGGASFAELRQAMAVDKKARGNELRFVLLEGLGRPVVVSAPPEPALERAYQAIQEL